VDLRRLGSRIDTVEKVDDAILLKWLEEHSSLKKDGLSAAQVNSIVAKKLRINMGETDTEQRIIMLFADYASLLRSNGLSWITEGNPKIAVGHILDALKPKPLKARVKDDIEFAHSHLKKDFLSFMNHVIKRAEIYSDYGDAVSAHPSRGNVHNSTPASKSSDDSSGSAGKQPARGNNTRSARGSPGQTKVAPDCLNPACKEKHFLKECKNTTQELKDELYAQRSQARKNNGEQRTTRADDLANTSRPATGQASQGHTTHTSAGVKAVRAPDCGPEGGVQISFGTSKRYIALPDIGANDNTIPTC
jgi:hypothetical protein